MTGTGASGGVDPARHHPAVRRTALALALLAYVAASWFPFSMELPRTEENRVSVDADGTWRFTPVGLASTPGPPPWLDAAIEREYLAVRLEARSLDPDQRGPARLLALSRDHERQNLVIGQDDADLVIRIARTGADLRGEPPLRVPDTFRTGAWRTIELEVGEGIRVRVDDESELTVPRAAVFSAWDADHRLALGNEPSGWRPWAGELRAAAVDTGDGPTDLLAHGAVARPSRVTLLPESHHEPNTDRPVGMALPIWGMHVTAGAIVAGLLAATMGASASRVVSVWLLLCLVANVAKFVMDGRHVSLTTICLQALGGALGVLLVRRMGATPNAAVVGR